MSMPRSLSLILQYSPHFHMTSSLAIAQADDQQRYALTIDRDHNPWDVLVRRAPLSLA